MAQDYRWTHLGAYGAQGIPGAEALGAGIERMVTGIASPADTRRGVAARLAYLAKSRAGRAALADAGISQRSIAAWTAGKRSPSAKSRAKLDDAYWGLRRERVVTRLKQRLANGGRGTRIEIDPVDQRAVDTRYQRDLHLDPSVRNTTIRPHVWDRAVDAWIAGDRAAMEAIWEEIITGLGSDWDAYTYVSSVGWAA